MANYPQVQSEEVYGTATNATLTTSCWSDRIRRELVPCRVRNTTRARRPKPSLAQIARNMNPNCMSYEQKRNQCVHKQYSCSCSNFFITFLQITSRIGCLLVCVSRPIQMVLVSVY